MSCCSFVRLWDHVDLGRGVGPWKPPATVSARATRAQRAISRSICTDGRCVRQPRRSEMASYKPDSCAFWLRRRQSQGSCRCARSSLRNHVRGAPSHPQTQGKIERWHQTLKSLILPENYYLPGDLQAHISRFSITTIAATTRACRTSPRPMSTSDVVKPSCCNVKGSSATPSNEDDCRTNRKPPNLKQQRSQSLPSQKTSICPKAPDDGHFPSLLLLQTANHSGGPPLGALADARAHRPMTTSCRASSRQPRAHSSRRGEIDLGWGRPTRVPRCAGS
jgi:hypothetical protein